MNDTLNNQLAQVCNNLFCIIRIVKLYRSKSATGKKLRHTCCELEAEYNKLFKLIYGDK